MVPLTVARHAPEPDDPSTRSASRSALTRLRGALQLVLVLHQRAQRLHGLEFSRTSRAVRGRGGGVRSPGGAGTHASPRRRMSRARPARAGRPRPDRARADPSGAALRDGAALPGFGSGRVLGPGAPRRTLVALGFALGGARSRRRGCLGRGFDGSGVAPGPVALMLLGTAPPRSDSGSRPPLATSAATSAIFSLIARRTMHASSRARGAGEDLIDRWTLSHSAIMCTSPAASNRAPTARALAAWSRRAARPAPVRAAGREDHQIAEAFDQRREELLGRVAGGQQSSPPLERGRGSRPRRSRR